MQIPKERERGDLSLPCFPLAKVLGRSPVEIASIIVEAITDKNPMIRVVAEGPFVNFFFDSAYLAQRLLSPILEQGIDYGRGDDKHKTILIE